MRRLELLQRSADISRCLTYAQAHAYDDLEARLFCQIAYAIQTTMSLDVPTILTALVTARDELITHLLASGKVPRG